MNKKLLQEKPLFITSALKKVSGPNERELDKLNLLPYAEALTDFIESAETPMTVGLQGDWGSGKTSMLNMLRGSEQNTRSGLLNSQVCLVINFETWSYAQFNDRSRLPMACLYALTEKLGEALRKEKLLNEKADQTYKKTSSKLMSVIKKSLEHTNIGVMGISIPVGKAIKEASHGHDDDENNDTDNMPPDDLSKQMIEFRNNFADLVKVWTSKDTKKRVVVCIDDLDRVEPIVALELLESIKNFLDVDGCVFILAVDYEIVQEGMKQKLGGDIQKTTGKSFFDKIIQLPFNMPKSNYNIKNYISILLEEAKFPQSSKIKQDDDLQFLESITLCSIGGNPRSIKRVMNYARLLNIIREKSDLRSKSNVFTKTDSKIMYALICLQIAWPEVFAHFMAEPTAETMQNLENWDYLDRTPELRPLFDRVRDEEGLKNDISTFIDSLVSELDQDDNGQVSQEEFEPVRKVLNMAKFTTVEMKTRPRDEFRMKAEKNAKLGKVNEFSQFMENIFGKTKIFTSSEIKYRLAGSRYITLVYKRKQLGSLVSVKNSPIVIRLNGHPDSICSEASKILNYNKISQIVRDLNENEGSITGFGETFIDIIELMSIDKDNVFKIKLMNAIITGTEKLIDERLIH